LQVGKDHLRKAFYISTLGATQEDGSWLTEKTNSLLIYCQMDMAMVVNDY
jgi:uncharacterized membrane protein SirB2